MILPGAPLVAIFKPGAEVLSSSAGAQRASGCKPENNCRCRSLSASPSSVFRNNRIIILNISYRVHVWTFRCPAIGSSARLGEMIIINIITFSSQKQESFKDSKQDSWDACTDSSGSSQDRRRRAGCARRPRPEARTRHAEDSRNKLPSTTCGVWGSSSSSSSLSRL